MPDENVLTGLLPRIVQLSTALNRGHLYERATSAAGVSLERPAMTILAILSGAERPLRVGEIAAQMQVEGPHVTRHLHGLEQRGMVGRVVDPDDRRARQVTLTPAGRSVVDRYLPVILGWFTEAMSAWSEQDRHDLIRLLGRMVDDLTVYLSKVEAGTEG